MKKTLIILAVLLLCSGMAHAADELGYFGIILNGGVAFSDTAGNPVYITISARDTEGDLMDGGHPSPYGGSVILAASVGEVYIESTGNSTTSAFTNGMWTGIIQMRGAADPVTLTATDDITNAPLPVTGTTSLGTMLPGAYNPPSSGKILILSEGMVFAPGTTTGYTGSPDPRTINVPFDITVYACDDWYNPVTANLPTIGFETSALAADASPDPINMAADGTGNTVVTVNITSPDVSGTYSLIERDQAVSSEYGFLNIQFGTLNEYYMWAEFDPENPSAGDIIYAGEFITTTVKVSHTDYGNTINGFGESVRIYAADASGNTTGVYPLLPVAQPQAALVNGAKDFIFSYTKSGQMRIKPRPLGATPMDSIHNSGILTVYPLPASSCEAGSDDTRLSRGETTTVYANVRDPYGNPVSGTAVTFSVSGGSGTFTGNTTNVTAQALPDAGYDNAVASVVYTAPSANLENVIKVSVPGAADQYVTVASILTMNFENWPNPFNPGIESTKIHYFLDEDSSIEMKIYSMFGNLVWSKNITPGEIGAGGELHGVGGAGNTVTWNGRTKDGHIAGAGLYVVKMVVTNSAGTNTFTRKIAVVK